MTGVKKVSKLDAYNYRDNYSPSTKDKFNLSDFEDFLHIENKFFKKKNFKPPHYSLKEKKPEEKKEFLFSEKSINELKKYIFDGVEYYKKIISEMNPDLMIFCEDAGSEKPDTIKIRLLDLNTKKILYCHEICLSCIKNISGVISIFSDIISHKGLLFDIKS